MAANRGNERAIRVLLVFGAGFLGFVLGALLIVWVNKPKGKDTAPEPPEIGGAKVPARLHTINFNLRYDIICGNSEVDRLNYRNCRILGFTGDQKGKPDSYYSSYSEYLDHWLVLELPDRRKAYLPPNQIIAFEEAKIRR